jgi:hypothetical protein
VRTYTDEVVELKLITTNLERIAIALEIQNARREQFDAQIYDAIDQITNMMSLAATRMVGIQGHES